MMSIDAPLKVKETNVGLGSMTQNPTAVAAAAAVVVAAASCNSDSFSNIPPPPPLNDISTNSLELNAAASLSDDSGVPLTTNSSISSGDSYRLGLCKFEIEVCESDGEVSQFDSLENCSEGGMSGECFNTLKKGPLAPIDPPPEFQDSPKNTLVQSSANNIVSTMRRWTSSQTSFEYLKDQNNFDPQQYDCNAGNNIRHDNNDDDDTLRSSYSNNKHLYSSDSILNIISNNIYDEPNNIISTSLNNSIDVEDSESSLLPPPPPPVSIVKIRHTLCPFYQDHTRYFKAITSEDDGTPTEIQHTLNLFEHSDIHDYDLYYGAKRNMHPLQEATHHQRRAQCSPINQSQSQSQSQHFYNQYHYTGINSGNRPNSRNSLNSRLSSSHNSLNISSANKPDDSIFITQAMSHDALLTREITDFYNVPVDSDIYAFPVDTIPVSDIDCKKDGGKQGRDNGDCVTAVSFNVQCLQHSNNLRSINKKSRKCFKTNFSEIEWDKKRCNHHRSIGRVNCRSPLLSSCSVINQKYENFSSREALQMTLDDVKEFYHTLYSKPKSSCGSLQPVEMCLPIAKSSNETLSNLSSTRSSDKLIDTSTTKSKCSAESEKAAKNPKPSEIANDNDNVNNNNVSAISKQHSSNKLHRHLMQAVPVSPPENYQPHPQIIQQQQPANVESNNVEISSQAEKKSQFTLNLKQKFCSIFRFRKNYNRCRLKDTDVEDNTPTKEHSFNTKNAEDKQKKMQFRALPPLPKKTESNIESYGAAMADNATKDQQQPISYKFTSSIEKVKNYGWYWGPLSSEAAEKVLSNEPDGSFIVRDSSDDHYIFSLSFKLNSCVRHVRIEQDQGTFSFGSYAKFKSQTITEFIEKAVEHSRSGRYLFFLHRRPEHGPMRVQLTNPVSRFKHVQSLQHMCRFVILKTVVRKDLIQTLPLPRRLLDYLNYKHCYSEQVECDTSNSQISGEGSI